MFENLLLRNDLKPLGFFILCQGWRPSDVQPSLNFIHLLIIDYIIYNVIFLEDS